MFLETTDGFVFWLAVGERTSYALGSALRLEASQNLPTR